MRAAAELYRELLMGALRLLPIKAPNELILEAVRELLGGAAMELLKVVTYKLHLEAPK